MSLEATTRVHAIRQIPEVILFDGKPGFYNGWL
jgi:hypothetical protein